MDAISIISIFPLESICFTIYYYLNRFLHMFKIFFNLQNIISTYNLHKSMFSIYVLHKRHGQFFGAHSRIVFLKSVGDTIFFNSFGKMRHIFGPKLDIVCEPYMTVLVLLQRCAIPKTIIAFFLVRYFC